MRCSSMNAVTRVPSLRAAALAALITVIATPASADLRISDLDVVLDDQAMRQSDHRAMLRVL